MPDDSTDIDIQDLLNNARDAIARAKERVRLAQEDRQRVIEEQEIHRNWCANHGIDPDNIDEEIETLRTDLAARKMQLEKALQDLESALQTRKADDK